MTVTNGHASKNVVGADVGLHQVTAVFTPTNPANFQPSTSGAKTVTATQGGLLAIVVILLANLLGVSSL